jgi:hypothetical protein
MIYCEVLKINTNEVWAFNYEVQIGSEIWQQLQDSDNPLELGCTFVRVLENNILE